MRRDGPAGWVIASDMTRSRICLRRNGDDARRDDDAPLEPSRWVLYLGPPGREAFELCGALASDDLFPVVRSDAAAALQAVHEGRPCAIACERELPDGDGASFVRWVRAHQDLDGVPIVVLGDESMGWRLECFQAGADGCLDRGLGSAAIAKQLGALVRMSERVEAALPKPNRKRQPAIEGDLCHLSIPTLLQAIELDRLTGTFEVASGDDHVTLDLVRGHAVGGASRGRRVSPYDALRPMLAMRTGYYAFRRKRVRDLTSTSAPDSEEVVRIGQLLAYALVEVDHATRAAAGGEGALRLQA